MKVCCILPSDLVIVACLKNLHFFLEQRTQIFLAICSWIFLSSVEIVSVWLQVVLGTLLAALVPVVGFNAVLTSEHFASFLVSVFPWIVGCPFYILLFFLLQSFALSVSSSYSLPFLGNCKRNCLLVSHSVLAFYVLNCSTLGIVVECPKTLLIQGGGL